MEAQHRNGSLNRANCNGVGSFHMQSLRLGIQMGIRSYLKESLSHSYLSELRLLGEQGRASFGK
jgi:hypothetical protein